LTILSWFGIVWDLRTPPDHIKARILAPIDTLTM
jgi:hypothetical protein